MDASPPATPAFPATLEHENLLAMLRFVGSQVPGSALGESSGVAHALTGIPIRLFNVISITGDEATADGVARAIALARAREDRWVLNLRKGTDDAFVPLAVSHGLVPLEPDPWMPGMAVHPLVAARPAPVPGGVTIRQVDDGAGVEDHAVTAAAGFGLPEDWVRPAVTLAVARHPDCRLYVAYRGDEPVGTGLGLRTGRTIGVYNIATVESARRQGLGAAMTARVMDDGLADGCDVAILQASAMGQPIYERLGFQTVVEYTGWIEPEPEA